jgi:hypothetical protein
LKHGHRGRGFIPAVHLGDERIFRREMAGFARFLVSEAGTGDGEFIRESYGIRAFDFSPALVPAPCDLTA